MTEPGMSESSSRDAIDVVIPVHNGASYIRDSIGSALSQTLQPRRVIVVDDGSTDDSAAVVSALAVSDPRIVLHRIGRSVGVSAARNAGIKLSQASFIAFLDADDIWTPDKLMLQMQAFERGGEAVGFVHSSFFLMDEAGNTLPHNNGPPPLQRGDVFLRLLQEGNIISGSASAVLVKREVLDAAGFFDDRLYFGEDWDVWMRLAAISQVDHAPEAVVGIRVHPKSMQRGRTRSGIDLLLQLMIVYSRWEALVSKDVGLVQRLRREGYVTLLSNTRSLGRIDFFYQSVSRLNPSLARSLYGSRVQFWGGIVTTLANKLYAKLAQGGRHALAPVRLILMIAWVTLAKMRRQLLELLPNRRIP